MSREPLVGPPPLPGLVAALVVLVAGITAAFTHDSSTTATRTAPGFVSSTRPVTSTSVPTTRSTFGTLPPTSSTTTTSTTVRPAVPSPEAAANGLWAAYSTDTKVNASRFATQEVVDALFSTPYSGETGTFQGCTARAHQTGVFDCRYEQPSTRYLMGAQSDDKGSFKIVALDIAPIDTTTSTADSTFSSST